MCYYVSPFLCTSITSISIISIPYKKDKSSIIFYTLILRVHNDEEYLYLGD